MSDAFSVNMPQPSGPRLACPFCKRNPFRWRRCKSLSFRHLSDLRVHIERVHKKPVFCAICKEVFKGDGAYARHDEHLRQEPPCQPTADPDIAGDISARDYDALFLANKGKRGRQAAADGVDNIHKGWYYIWDKLFPGIPRPDSIFWHTSPATDLAASHVAQYMASNIPQQHLFTQLFQQFGVYSDLQTTQSILDILFGDLLVSIERGEQAPFVNPTPPAVVLEDLDGNIGEGPIQPVGLNVPSLTYLSHEGGDGPPPDDFHLLGPFLGYPGCDNDG